MPAKAKHGIADVREVMNIREAADYLGISADSLYKYASENTVPAFKLGNRWRFKRSLLNAWMEDQSLNSGTVIPFEPTEKKPAARVVAR